MAKSDQTRLWLGEGVHGRRGRDLIGRAILYVKGWASSLVSNPFVLIRESPYEKLPFP
jgi:hypothetical protein